MSRPSTKTPGVLVIGGPEVTRAQMRNSCVCPADECVHVHLDGSCPESCLEMVRAHFDGRLIGMGNGEDVN